METYAFLPREAVTAFLMGCPQCSTNNTTLTTVDNMQQLLPSTVTTTGFCDGVHIEQWSSSSSFACSTPVKREAENIEPADTTEPSRRPLTTVVADVQNKENVIMDNGGQTTAAVAILTKLGNKRKRTVPLRRNVRQPCQVIATAAATATDTVMSRNTSTGSSTLKNSSNGSRSTLVLSSSSSSCRTNNSGLSRSSGGWWSKWGMCSNSSRLSGSVGSGSSDLSGNTLPLDLSPSPLLVVSPSSIRSLSSPSVATEDFFYRRRRVCRRRVEPKRLTRSCLGRCDNRHEGDEDTSASDRECSKKVIRDNYRSVVDSAVNEELNRGGVTEGRNVNSGERVGSVETDDDDDDGPRPAKMKRNNNNNNNEEYYDKTTVVDMVTTTVMVMTGAMAKSCCTSDSDRVTEEDAVTVDTMTDGRLMIKAEIREEFPESDGTELDESDENQVSHNIVIIVLILFYYISIYFI